MNFCRCIFIYFFFIPKNNTLNTNYMYFIVAGAPLAFYPTTLYHITFVVFLHNMYVL